MNMIAVWFWILMLFALLSGGYIGYNNGPWVAGNSLIWWLLFLLLGLKEFGSPL